MSDLDLSVSDVDLGFSVNASKLSASLEVSWTESTLGLGGSAEFSVDLGKFMAYELEHPVDVIEDAIDWFSDLTGGAVNKARTIHIPVFNPSVSAKTAKVDEVGEAQLTEYGKQVIDEFGTDLEGAFKALADKCKAFTDSIFDAAEVAIDKLTFGDLESSVSAILGLLPNAYLVPMSFDDVRDAIRDALEDLRDLRDFALHALSWVVYTLKRGVYLGACAMIRAGEQVAAVLPYIRSFFHDPRAWLKDVVADLAEEVVQKGEKIRDKLLAVVGGIRELWEDIADYVDDLLEEVIRRLMIAGQSLKWFLEETWEVIQFEWKSVVDLIGFFASTLSDTSGKLFDVAAEAGAFIWEKYQDGALADWAWGNLGTVLDRLCNRLGDDVDLMIDKLLGAAHRTVGDARLTIAGFGYLLASLGRRLQLAVCRVFKAQADLLALVVGEAQDKFKQLLDFVLRILAATFDAVVDTLTTLYEVATEVPGIVHGQLGALGKWLLELQHDYQRAVLALFDLSVQLVTNAANPILSLLSKVIGRLLDLVDRVSKTVHNSVDPIAEEQARKLQGAMAALEEALAPVTEFLGGNTESGFTARCELETMRLFTIAVDGIDYGGGDITFEGGDNVEDEIKYSLDPPQDLLLFLMEQVLDLDQLLVLDVQAFNSRLETPLPQTVRDAASTGLVPEERRGFEATHSVQIPVPLVGMTQLAQLAKDSQLLPTLRFCLGARSFPIDPRYSLIYGDTLRLSLADLDNDDAVTRWEAARARGSLGATGGGFDANRDGTVTLEDIQLIMDQSRFMMNGIPYRESASPLGVFLDWKGGSWLWMSWASLDETGIKTVQRGQQDASEERIDRTGLGLFLHGQLSFPALGKLAELALADWLQGQADASYPVRFNVEARLFHDAFAGLPIGTTGASVLTSLRGGTSGNDWQLMLRSNVLPPFAPVPPFLTRRAYFQVSAVLGGSAVAGLGGKAKLKVGLKYVMETPMVERLHELSESLGELSIPEQIEEVKRRVDAVSEDFEELARLFQRLIAPWLSVLAFDTDLEGRLLAMERILSSELPGPDPLDLQQEAELEGEANGYRVDVAHTATKRGQAVAAEALRNLRVWSTRQVGQGDSGKHPELLEECGITAAERKELLNLLVPLRGEFAEFVLQAEATPVEAPAVKVKEETFKKTWQELGKVKREDLWDDFVAEVYLGHYAETIQAGGVRLLELLVQQDFKGAWDCLSEALAGVTLEETDTERVFECVLALLAILDLFVEISETIFSDPQGVVARYDTNRDGKVTFGDEFTGTPEEFNKHDVDQDGVITAADKEALNLQKGMRKAVKDYVKSKPWKKPAPGEKKKDFKGSFSAGSMAGGKVSLLVSLLGGVAAGAAAEAGGSGEGGSAAIDTEVEPLKFTPPPVKFLKPLSSKLTLARLVIKLIKQGLRVCGFMASYVKEPSLEKLLTLQPKVCAWTAIALAEAFKEMVHDHPRWVERVLAMSSLHSSLKAKVDATGTAGYGSLIGEYSVDCEASVALTSLLDPILHVMERGLAPQEGMEALSNRITPKISIDVTDDASLALSGMFVELKGGLIGNVAHGDFSLPDGSEWRTKLEDWLRELAKSLEAWAKAGRGETVPVLPRVVGFLDLVDAEILRQLVWLADNPDRTYSAAAANPIVQDLMAELLEPGSVEAQGRKRSQALTAALEDLETHAPKPVRTPEGLVQIDPDIDDAAGVVVSGFFSDEDAAKLSGNGQAGSVRLANVITSLELQQPAKRLVWNAYRHGERSDEGIAVGFDRRSEAEAFCSRRPEDWLELEGRASQKATVWAMAGYWFCWLDTRLIGALSERGLPLPGLELEGTKALLRFEHVEREKSEGLAELSGIRVEGTEPYQKVPLLSGAKPDEARIVHKKVLELAG